MLTGVALGVVQALEAGACPGVTRARVVHVDVVVALAGHAAAAGHQRVAEVAGGTLVAPVTCMAPETGSTLRLSGSER